MLWNTDMIIIDLMKWFWTIKITDRCQQLIWSHAEQTIHTYLFITVIVQRNFTHLIRCQTMKVKPYIILNTSRKHVNYEEVPMNKPCNIFHISFFKALLINEGERDSVRNDPDSIIHNFFLNTIKKYKIWKYSVFSILLQNIKYCNKDLLTD